MRAFPVNPPPTSFTAWSDERRNADLRETMARAPDPDALWVFAAGSLIWDPRFEPAETRAATLQTHTRAFSFWTIRSRGSVERPGLGLALEPGGECAGVAFLVPEQGREDILDALWQREMSGGVYVPTWIDADTEFGTIPTLGFVANHAHRNYAGLAPLEDAARIIADARGTRGTCHEYVALLVEALDRHGLEDTHTRALHERIQSH
ncbi:MAG: gamma-glutamylcyclotransferase, partial [Alphaproteobacteria bacterium]|nr:gamma-glutamylcyclotransferase [Alphaproteobacteria bacterium]